MTHTREPNGLRTWIEVDRGAIRHNFGVFKKLIKSTKLMAVVKSNAYGHDLVQFSREAERLGADWLGVDSMTEARALRREGLTLPILVLGYTVTELFAEAAEHGISLTVSASETLNALKKIALKKPLKIHIKVDAGMHRQGFLRGDVKKVLNFFRHPASGIQLQGLYTHFSSAKNPAFPQDTKQQIAEFEEWVAAFRKAGLRPLVHASATAGALLFPDAQYDMVRIGIGLYGLWPAHETEAFLKGRITLRPALAWKAVMGEIKKLPAGSRMGYDLTETLVRNSVVGIVPVGYWHGLPRALSSVGRVQVGARECKILGRVSMDMLTIDLTEAKNPRVGDEVVLVGRDQASSVSAEGIARLTDSSWYEVVTRLNPLIKRIYTGA